MIMGIPGNASVQVIRVPTEGLAKGRTRGGGAHDKGQPAAQPCQSGCLEILNKILSLSVFKDQDSGLNVKSQGSTQKCEVSNMSNVAIECS